MSTQRYRHVRFYKLKHGEEFFLASRRFIKSDIYKAFAVLDGKRIFVMPWRKVRSARRFGKVNPRPPVPVTPGGDRTPETIGGSELTPSS